MRPTETRFYVAEAVEDELALAGAALALIARLGGAAPLLLPPIVVLIVIPAAVLTIAGVSSLTWRSRLRGLARRNPHDRPRVHARHHRLLCARGRLYPRLRSSVRRAP